MTMTRFPWVATILFLISGGIQLNPDLASWLEFDVRSSQMGEFWRPLTGHLCHYNRSHFVGDVMAFCVWASAVELISRRLFVGALLGTPAVLGGWLLALGPSTLNYRGLSAVDCALATQLFTTAYLSNAARCRSWLRGTLIGIGAVMLFKSVYEFTAGHAIFAPELGHRVRLLPEAHVLGVLVGLATTLWCRSRAGTRHGGLAGRPPADLAEASGSAHESRFPSAYQR